MCAETPCAFWRLLLLPVILFTGVLAAAVVLAGTAHIWGSPTAGSGTALPLCRACLTHNMCFGCVSYEDRNVAALLHVGGSAVWCPGNCPVAGVVDGYCDGVHWRRVVCW